MGGMRKPNISGRQWMLLAFGAALIALLCLMQFVFMPGGFQLAETVQSGSVKRVTEIAPVSGVCINEVMTSNRTAWAGANGLYADWVELKNTGAQPIDITGWTLTDRDNRAEMFTFPAHVLSPGEMALVYMTGELRRDAGQAYQAPFRLSAAGDSLLLYDAGGAIMEAMNIPPLEANQVYARGGDGRWVTSGIYTPGLENTADNHRLITEPADNAGSTIAINEIMAENQSTIQDKDGDYSDWIELKNIGDRPVDLAGYYLSDNPDRAQQFSLPSVTIEPGGVVIVFASGKDTFTAEGEIHANFKLNAEGETVVLTDASGRRVAAVSYELLRADQAYARQGDGTYQKDTPSPGKP